MSYLLNFSSRLLKNFTKILDLLHVTEGGRISVHFLLICYGIFMHSTVVIAMGLVSMHVEMITNLFKKPKSVLPQDQVLALQQQLDALKVNQGVSFMRKQQ